MTRWGGHDGLTLVELLVGLTITVLVFGLVLTSLDVFQRNNRIDQLRNEAQDNARSAIELITRELRNVSAPSKGAAGALEQAFSYELVFQTVSSSQIFGGENKTNQMRVRYCLDASTSTSETLWRQTQTWTSAGAPAVPSTSTCPSSSWSTQSALARNITNKISGQDRGLFIYGPSANPTELSEIRSVETDLFINVSPSQAHPGESELKDGVFLRNSLSPPEARFTITQLGIHQVLLNGSASSDPNGQALSYQWSLDGSPMSGATSQQYESRVGQVTEGSHVFALKVTDTAGLSDSEEKAATIK